MLAFFVGLPLVLGVHWAWKFRHQPGRVTLDSNGIHCTLPWRRRLSLPWDRVLEVRRVGAPTPLELSFWEILGSAPTGRVLITWQLKGFENLLRTVRKHARNLQRFDPELEDSA